MWWNIAYSLIGAVIGTVVGSIGTWYVSRRLAYYERLQNAIESACIDVQEYAATYGQYYVEYLSPLAQEARGHWAQMPGRKPDDHRMECERRVDSGRGRLRVHRVILERLLPGEHAQAVDDALREVLHYSSPQTLGDCRDVDEFCHCAIKTLASVLPVSKKPTFRWRKKKRLSRTA
jgi:hypothetical protein